MTRIQQLTEYYRNGLFSKQEYTVRLERLYKVRRLVNNIHLMMDQTVYSNITK
jgi:hypothetical protein